MTNGADFIADYGLSSFRAVENGHKLARIECRGVFPPKTSITLNAGTFEHHVTRSKALRTNLWQSVLENECHLVQFAGPIKPEGWTNLKKNWTVKV